MSALAAALVRTPVTRIEDVVACMDAIDRALPAADGVSCFNKLYLAVTRNVLAATGQATFADPRFLAALDVAFANLYFSALRALKAAGARARARRRGRGSRCSRRARAGPSRRSSSRWRG